MSIENILRNIIREEVSIVLSQSLNEISNRKSPIQKVRIAMPEMMTVEAFAKYIGCSKPTVYGLIHRNTLPYYKPTKRAYFTLSEVNGFLIGRQTFFLYDIFI